MKDTIACFVSPHGFGHAARAAAVLAALYELNPAVHFEIFTRVPDWFFLSSLPAAFGYHSVLTDIGLVQTTALHEDLPATVRRLNEFLPFDLSQVETLAQQVIDLGCRLVLCDIAPLGIAVARAAGLPSVLVENFTWDWIYEGYPDEPGLEPHLTYLRRVFESADYHIQTEPICAPGPVHLAVPPISRKIKKPAALVRQELDLPEQARVILLTMGGLAWRYTFLEALSRWDEAWFVIPGAIEQPERRGQTLLLPYRSSVFHPDLVGACDAVIGKIGYSTLAEVYQAGIPFGYVARFRFREGPVLARYVEREMNGLGIDETSFQDDRWLAVLPELLIMPRREPGRPNGSGPAARFIQDLLQAQSQPGRRE